MENKHSELLEFDFKKFYKSLTFYYNVTDRVKNGFLKELENQNNKTIEFYSILDMDFTDVYEWEWLDSNEYTHDDCGNFIITLNGNNYIFYFDEGTWSDMYAIFKISNEEKTKELEKRNYKYKYSYKLRLINT